MQNMYHVERRVDTLQLEKLSNLNRLSNVKYVLKIDSYHFMLSLRLSMELELSFATIDIVGHDKQVKIHDRHVVAIPIDSGI